MKILSNAQPSAGTKQRITLEYLRDEDIDGLGQDASTYEREKNKIRKILIGNCRMMDNKMEKNAAYEITPAVSIILFLSIFRKMISSLNAII